MCSLYINDIPTPFGIDFTLLDDKTSLNVDSIMLEQHVHICLSKWTITINDGRQNRDSVVL
jgi:hypothetical protein